MDSISPVQLFAVAHRPMVMPRLLVAISFSQQTLKMLNMHLIMALRQQLFLASKSKIDNEDQIRFAFDGDAVLFSDEAERVYKFGRLMYLLKVKRHPQKSHCQVGLSQRVFIGITRLAT